MKVLFKCKGNICRSPAAEAYLRMRRPHWFCYSVATTRNTRGMKFHEKMVEACLKRKIPASKNRIVVCEIDYNNLDAEFDQVFDLHELGIQDPYLTGDFDGALQEIIDFVDSKIINP